MITKLDQAIKIAVDAHAGQKDKAGKPYILHPLRVMLKLQGETERIVAVLHDVVEDSDWTLEGLRDEGFPAEVLEALDCLTRRENETYEAFVKRASTNPIARVVKIADLQDNMDLGRIDKPAERDLARVRKYQKALRLLKIVSFI